MHLKIKEILFSFSLANLCLLNAWSAVWAVNRPSTDYFRKSMGGLHLAWATLLASLLLTLGFWIIFRLVLQQKRLLLTRIAESGLLLLLVVPLGTVLRDVLLATESAGLSSFLFTTVVVIKLGLVTAALFIVLSPARRVVGLAKLCVMLATPIAPVNLVSLAAARMMASSGQHKVVVAKGQELPRHSGTNRAGARLVILLFDGFDQYLAFEGRPKSVSLPELDRLRQESVFSSNAYPASRLTLTAVPAMTTGKLVRAARPLDPRHLRLTFMDNHTSLWGEEPSLFSRTAEAGWRVGVSGWYHPYCRVFGAILTECSWEQGFADDCFNAPGLLEGSLNVFKRLNNLLTLDGYFGIAPTLPFLATDVALTSHAQLRSYKAVLSASLRMVTNAELDLVFVHWPIPHPFGIYDRKTGRLGIVAGSNYLDNLELVDATLIQLRQALEASGLRDSTSILITSDHPFRRELWKDFASHQDIPQLLGTVDNSRVPFILKLARQGVPTSYARAFNLVLVHDLSLALLRREVSTAAEFVEWMDRNRKRFSTG